MRLRRTDRAWLEDQLSRMIAATRTADAASAKWGRVNKRFNAEADARGWSFDVNPSFYTEAKSSNFYLRDAYDDGEWWRKEASYRGALISGFVDAARLLEEDAREAAEAAAARRGAHVPRPRDPASVA